MEAAMHRKSFRAAYWFALLALALQLLALPASAGHQAARLHAGQTVVCTPLGTFWVFTGDAAPEHEESWQAACPLCNLSQHNPGLPSWSASFQAPDSLVQGTLPASSPPPTARPFYARAQPRAPPL